MVEGKLDATKRVYVDHVERREEFVKRHPHVSITTPRQNGTRDFIASWHENPADEESAVEEIRHGELGRLMDKLQDRFGR